MQTISQLFTSFTPYVLESVNNTLKSWNYYYLSCASLISNPLDLHHTLLKPMAKNIENLYFNILTQFFEKIDNDFFNSDDRKKLYRAKGKKPRTIITMFGSFTYTRHSYQLKSGGNHFYFIDIAFGIEKHQRFEKAVLLEIYRLIGSEISFSQVGKMIGNLIYRNQNLNEKYQSLSRQTIHAIFKRLDTNTVVLPVSSKQADTLYIEADEHFVASQRKVKKIMVKAAKIYTKDSNGVKQTPLYFLDSGQLFWESCAEFIQTQYDLDNIQKIHIIGDGANWIRNGVRTFDRGKASFSLDLFHYMQSLQLFFGKNNLSLKEIAINYLLNNNKQDFLTCIETFYVTQQRKTEAFDSQYQYLKKHYRNIQKSFKNKTSCSMENTISHVIASICTSRPKGFNTTTLFKRLKLRMIYLNSKNKESFYKCFNKQENKQNSYNDVFKTFERMYKPCTYRVNIRPF